MSLGHASWRRCTALLAVGALDEPEAARTRAHHETCAECARDLAAARAALDLFDRAAVRTAELPIPAGALATRVHARLDEEARRPRRQWRLVLAGLAAAAAVAVAAVAIRSTSPAASPAEVAETAVSPATEMGLPADALLRLERTLERERAARYLSDAQDVLVTVASAPQRCARRRAAVEVGAEAERSRELLARRRLFVETDGAAIVGARDVLDDVEEILREVAALDPCARPDDLEAIRGEIARRRLLMKIDLVTRELQG